MGRHLDPAPRFEVARYLWAHGATALMDVSDGLALDLSRIAELSRVRIDLERVPVHRDARRLARRSGRTAREHALADGEDYEILATLAEQSWRALARSAARRFPELVQIGRVRRGSGLWLGASDSGALAPWNRKGGWIHGS